MTTTQQRGNHGGARPGAGRKPRALTHAAHISAIEQTIVDALPPIIDKVIQMAKDGDLKAARYLIDRVLGRVARQPSPPSMSGSLTIEGQDAESTPIANVQAAPSTPHVPAQTQRLTPQDIQEAAFGPRTFLPTLEIIRRDIDAEIQRRDKRPRLPTAFAAG